MVFQQKKIILVFLWLWFIPPLAWGHFGMVIPETAIVLQPQKKLHLALSFSHPFSGTGMDIKQPQKFYVFWDQGREDIASTLQQAEIMGHKGWQTTFQLTRPGVYHFVMEPVPYWEEAEDKFIIHYTKTIVSAYGVEEGWDKEHDLPAEIIPLSRPFGLYAGYVFRAMVKVKGKAAPYVPVEVEYYNQRQRIKARSHVHETYVVKTNGNGIFSFACPWPGWWGFSAVTEADFTLLSPEGVSKPVEIGAVLWLKADKVLKK